MMQLHVELYRKKQCNSESKWIKCYNLIELESKYIMIKIGIQDASICVLQSISRGLEDKEYTAHARFLTWVTKSAVQATTSMV